MRPLLSLVMIVRDEAASIAETLGSVRGVCDRYTILDTGSTDATKEIIRAVMSDVPGTLHEESFVDFSTTRNRALDLEAADSDHAVFTLMLSGDECLRDGLALRDFLEQHRESSEDAFCARIQMEASEWYYPRVLRVGSHWRYEGKVHEAPVDREAKRDSGPVIPIAWIEHVVSDPDKRLMGVLEHHIPIFKEALAEDPKDTRSLMYLAQSCEDVAALFDDGTALSFRMEAMGYYVRRLGIEGGLPVERLRAKLRLLALAEQIPGLYTGDEILARLDALCEEAPTMPEAHHLRAYATMKHRPILKVLEAAAKAADVARDAAADTDILFSRDTSCEWRCCLLVAMAAKRAAKYDEKYLSVAKEWASRGKAAGGPHWMFLAAISDPPVQAPIRG